jgi:nitroreductase
MEFLDVIKKRSAVREYTNALIERPVVERLINAAILAPSAMNLQPWAFAVVLDRGRIEQYAKRAKLWSLANVGQTSFTPELRKMLEDPDLTMFYHAPALVMVLAKSSDTQAAEDSCLAAENMMLGSRDEGLCTCWIGLARPWLDLPSTKAKLNLPNQCRVVAPIVLGHPKSWPESHARGPAEVSWLG